MKFRLINMAKVNQVWKELNAKMTAKRSRNHGGRNKSQKLVSREIVVQRLTAEPDNKQTYRPVQPREFVALEFDDLTLENLKSACASHFRLPVKTCDILVSNKGPSCTNINQIPHRKDKVYLVRFVVDLEPDDETWNVISSDSDELRHAKAKCARSAEPLASPRKMESQSYPASISIDQLMRAGKFVRPVPKTKTVLNLESFNVTEREWVVEKPINVFVENESFASGAFRDAYKAKMEGSLNKREWVIKRYNEKARITIVTTLSSTIEIHARKQVQMHSVARYLTKQFTSKLPEGFGEFFSYNKVFFALYEGLPVTVEKFVPGSFTKYINNNGSCTEPQGCDERTKEIYAKAEALVHFTYVVSKKKLMLLDIQGSGYSLYDPEIASKEIVDEDEEVYFCCGNLSTVSMEKFLSNHFCNKFHKMVIKSEK